MMLSRLVGTALLAFTLGACVKPPYTNVDNAELKTLMAQGVPVYDVRRDEEWRATGVVEGSRMLTYVDKSGRLNPEFLPRFTAEVGDRKSVV